MTENPAIGETEIWEMYNATADAHPIHIHEIVFEVVNRQDILVTTTSVGRSSGRPGSTAPIRRPSPGRSGFKDTVIAYPGQVTRVRAGSRHPGSSCGTATSSNTKTTK